MDAVAAGSGFMGMLQPLQLPEKPGVTPRFADLFAARTRDNVPDVAAGSDDPIGVLPGSLFGAEVHRPIARGGLVPLALPATDTAETVAVATDPMALVDVVDAGTPGATPHQVLIAVDSAAHPAGPRAVEVPRDWTRASADAVDTAAVTDADVAAPLPAADSRKLTQALSDAGMVQRPVAVPDSGRLTAEAADSKAAPTAQTPVSLAETLAEDGERLAQSSRVVSGVEVATLATLSPRSPGMPTADLRAAAPRTAHNAVNSPASVAPASVDEGSVDVPPVFDPAGGFEDGPNPVGLATAVTARTQPSASATPAAVVVADVSTAVTSAVDPTPRSAQAVDDVNALDQLDAPSEMAELSIDTPVDDPNWSEALNYRLQWLAQKGGAQSARIQLNPVELGPMEVHVEVIEDVATVQIRAEHGLTRDALEQAAPRLRELMTGAGLERAELEVSGGDADDARRAGADHSSGNRNEAQNAPVTADAATQTAHDTDRGGSSPTAGIDPDSGGGLNLYV